METIVGIDFGTTNSVISYMQENGTVKVIPNPEGHNATPSVIAFKANGEEIIGDAAKRQMLTNPDTVYSIKRHLGEKNYKVHISCLNKDFTPEELASKIIYYMKKYAEANLGHEVKKAVIACPAYFDDIQRNATRNAATMAGLEVINLVSEPTVSSLTYGIDIKKPQKIMVFDLGGGTLDVSVIETSNGVFRVLSTCGDTHLGGDDWDNAIINWLLEEILNKTGINLKDNKLALQRIKEEAEKAKINLSSELETTIELPYIGITQFGPVNFETTLTRAKFQDITKDLLNKCSFPVKQALADSNLSFENIDILLLVGGSTRMPQISNFIYDLTKIKPSQVLNPDEAVSVGASIQGAAISGIAKDIVLIEATSLTFSIEGPNGLMIPIIPRSTSFPYEVTKVFSSQYTDESAIDIVVYQGERAFASKNRLLGHFVMDHLVPVGRNEPRIEVTFSIDKNGILNVKGKDLYDPKNIKSVTIYDANNLSQNDVTHMIQDAEINRNKDNAELKSQNIINKTNDYIEKIEKATSLIKDRSTRYQLTKIVANLRLSLNKKDLPSLEYQLDYIDKNINF
jgi:molecular chaperone DnaK